ncbi:hypothetical protein [Massilia sp. YIM B04103]|uniref:hypothetical protein n=1 Tax=Massilia sp. YIM B04103 TaxID=2963106 RepID=UPI00210CB64A|nr:hypothetical protein [Massilia sp. YIM B04103]
MAEVDLNIGRQLEALVTGQLRAGIDGASNRCHRKNCDSQPANYADFCKASDIAWADLP